MEQTKIRVHPSKQAALYKKELRAAENFNNTEKRFLGSSCGRTHDYYIDSKNQVYMLHSCLGSDVAALGIEQDRQAELSGVISVNSDATTLYTDKDKAAAEFEQLKAAAKNANEIWDFIKSKGVAPDREDIEKIVKTGMYYTVVNKFEKSEFEKAKKFVETVGESVMTDGWENKVSDKVDEFRKNINSELPKIDGIAVLVCVVSQNNCQNQNLQD